MQHCPYLPAAHQLGSQLHLCQQRTLHRSPTELGQRWLEVLRTVGALGQVVRLGRVLQVQLVVGDRALAVRKKVDTTIKLVTCVANVD